MLVVPEALAALAAELVEAILLRDSTSVVSAAMEGDSLASSKISSEAEVVLLGLAALAVLVHTVLVKALARVDLALVSSLLATAQAR